MKALVILIICSVAVVLMRRNLKTSSNRTEAKTTKTTIRIKRTDPISERIKAEKQQIQLEKNRIQFEKLQHQAEVEKLKRYQAESDYTHYEQQIRDLLTAFEEGPKAEKATKTKIRQDDQIRKLDKKREQALAAWKMI